MSRRILLSSVCLFLLSLACAAPTPAPVDPVTPATLEAPAPATMPALAAQEIADAVAFLADDAQQGRPPGSEADARVQAWIVARMREAGLQPGAGDGFLQRFEVGDGVALRPGQSSRFSQGSGSGSGSKVEIAHALLPFGHDSGEAPVTGKLLFVGHGMVGEGDSAGDYEGLDAKKIQGAIVVVLAGSEDPHAAPTRTRPQSRLIAARDRGAVGFVLWDPNSDAPPPNHGQYSELGLPAVFVGQAGSAALRQALRARGDALPKRGAVSRGEFSVHTPIEPVLLSTANVIGVLPGSSPAKTRERIYIGAHMDHLGMGTASSLAPGEHAVHNGADDNASGVAVILAIAEALATIPVEQRPHDLVFVAFGAEEMGLLGSKQLVESMSAEERGRILAMLNFDMVGRLRDRLLVNGKGTAKEWPGIVAAANGDPAPSAEGESAESAPAESAAPADADEAVGHLAIEGEADGWGPSDHASFYGEGIPVLHFFTGSHEDYHKPSDDLDKLDAVGAAAIGELAGRIVLELFDHCEPLTYVEVERPTQGATRFKVSLGTMPDYGREVDGMAIAGVREGGPAALAGLQKGDVIKRIGEREIHNIDDYMASFGELEPGKTYEVAFERDGKLETASLTPAAPSR